LYTTEIRTYSEEGECNLNSNIQFFHPPSYIILSYISVFQKRSPLFVRLTNFILPLACYMPQIILPCIITVRLLNEKYRLWNPSLCNSTSFLRHLVQFKLYYLGLPAQTSIFCLQGRIFLVVQ